MVNFCNKVIEYSFYALFFLVPLFFTSNTFELFEFNKMWLTFAITLVIAGAWGTKMILQRRILLCRTPLDIPIVLFLLSQIIATIFSLDSHVSLWGYYSRFNGGLLSIISYIFLYYAFVSNFANERAGSPAMAGRPQRMVKRLLFVSLASGLAVVLWGIPSHFGYDPTCLLFRGTFDVSCWTEAFQPRSRIFSTLGQPNWLAAYLAILIPIVIAFAIQKTQNTQKVRTSDIQIVRFSDSPIPLVLRVFRVFWKYILLLLITLFYTALLFSGSRSGFYGLVSGLLVFIFLFTWNGFVAHTLKKNLILIAPIFAVIAVLSLYFGTPGTPKFIDYLSKLNKTQDVKQQESKPMGPALETGGTESGNIRLIVWKGAIEAWKNNPIFGTGVETFAFAYYKYRPKEHNLTSEWDFLYNKAHNEYLNYLTTTGVFGLGSYLTMISWFLFLSLKQFKIQNSKFKITTQSSKLKDKLLTLDSNFALCTLHFALISAYISILVSNFLGFSVVIVNLYLFLIPAFVFILTGMLPQQNELRSRNYELSKVSPYQWLGIFLLLLSSFFLLFTLFRFWQADTHYALGYNLDRARAYQMAYPELLAAFQTRGSEPVFLDELAFNSAMMSLIFINQKDATTAASFVQNALSASNKVTLEHPNNIVFWKTKTRILYALSQLDQQYTLPALEAVQRANLLAPTDAKISYNLGVLYGQSGDVKKAVSVLEETIRLKPNYVDAYYALGLFYHELKNDKKAVATMRYVLEHLDPKNQGAKTALKSWGL